MDPATAIALYKENIQPLRHGRNAAQLGTALRAQEDHEAQQMLVQEKQMYENSIKNYEGDDPLENWFEYILWVEQSYPKSGHESPLCRLLLQCLNTFEKDPKYRQDRRFIRLWINYISVQKNPIELYQLMYNNGIGTMVADFYRAWAFELEQMNDFRRADEVYVLGLQCRAEPYDELQFAHRDFQLAVARKTLGHGEEMNQVSLAEQRHAFSSLKAIKAGKTVGSIRTGQRVRDYMPGAIPQSTSTQSQGPKTGIQIYQDELPAASSKGNSILDHVPIDQAIHKENTIKPGPWNNAPKKCPLLTSSVKSSFKIHEDTDEIDYEKLKLYPNHISFYDDSKYDEDFLVPVFVEDVPNPNIILRTHYPKDLVYSNNADLSMEQIRAAKYLHRPLDNNLSNKAQNGYMEERHIDLQAEKQKQQELELAQQRHFEEEQKKLEAERIEAQRIEEERIEAQRIEEERIEAQRIEEERIEAQRIEEERLEAQRIEEEKLRAHQSLHNNSSYLSQHHHQSSLGDLKNHQQQSLHDTSVSYSSQHHHQSTSLTDEHHFLGQSLTVNTKEAISAVQDLWQSPDNRSNRLLASPMISRGQDTRFKTSFNIHMDSSMTQQMINSKHHNYVPPMQPYDDQENHYRNSFSSHENQPTFGNPACIQDSFQYSIQPQHELQSSNQHHHHSQNQQMHHQLMQSPHQSLMSPTHHASQMQVSNHHQHPLSHHQSPPQMQIQQHHSPQMQHHSSLMQHQSQLQNHSPIVQHHAQHYPNIQLQQSPSQHMHHMQQNSSNPQLSQYPQHYQHHQMLQYPQDSQVPQVHSMHPQQSQHIQSHHQQQSHEQQRPLYNNMMLNNMNYHQTYAPAVIPSLHDGNMGLQKNYNPTTAYNNSDLENKMYKMPSDLPHMKSPNLNYKEMQYLENKENAVGLGYNEPTGGILKNDENNLYVDESLGITPLPGANETCYTENFNRTLFASTPMTNHFKPYKSKEVEVEYDNQLPPPPPPQTVMHGPPIGEMGEKLSVIMETTREYVSSSSGSSGAFTRTGFTIIRDDMPTIKEKSDDETTSNSITSEQKIHVKIQAVHAQSPRTMQKNVDQITSEIKNNCDLRKSISFNETDKNKIQPFTEEDINCNNEKKDQSMDYEYQEPMEQVEEEPPYEIPTVNINPFERNLIAGLLRNMKFPNSEHAIGYHRINSNLNKFVPSLSVTLAKDMYDLDKCLGKGTYGTVFKAMDLQNNKVVALKTQKPAWVWEYYISREIKNRLKNPHMLRGFMDVSSAYIFDNGSVLVSEFSKYGTLLEVTNKMKIATGKPLTEPLAVFFTIEMLQIVEHLHKCKIIHADIKPDNFLLMHMPIDDLRPTIQLIDFGCSIDMTLFPEGTTFTQIIKTEDFTCIEMQTGKPWTYQTDLYCLAASSHCLLFGNYMRVSKADKKKWYINSKLPRYAKKAMWEKYFLELLNIESCDTLPDLAKLRISMEEALSEINDLQIKLRQFSNVLNHR